MSGKTGIIIQARMSSSRLPGKSLMKIGEKPLIWYVVQRAKLTRLPVIVSTSIDPSDDGLCDFLAREKIFFFRGDLDNVLDRYIKTAEEFGIENIVRVTGDNPLFDFEYLKKNLDLFNTFSYVDGIYEGGLIKGAGFELVKLQELQQIKDPDKFQKEHVSLALRQAGKNNPSYKMLRPGKHNSFREETVLTCDYKEDFFLIIEILAHFGYRYDISIEEIMEFFILNPKIFEVNRKLHQ